jgi:hypothetical protein
MQELATLCGVHDTRALDAHPDITDLRKQPFFSACLMINCFDSMVNQVQIASCLWYGSDLIQLMLHR